MCRKIPTKAELTFFYSTLDLLISEGERLMRYFDQLKQNSRTELGKDQFESKPVRKTEVDLAKNRSRKKLGIDQKKCPKCKCLTLEIIATILPEPSANSGQRRGYAKPAKTVGLRHELCRMLNFNRNDCNNCLMSRHNLKVNGHWYAQKSWSGAFFGRKRSDSAATHP